MRTDGKEGVAIFDGYPLLWGCLFLSVALVSLAFAVFNGVYLKGTDAYYYALQCDWLVRTGALRIPDPSVVFYGMAVFREFGMTAESAVRLWVFLSIGLAWGTGCFFLKRFNLHPAWFMAFIAWILFSPSLLFTSLEFPKMAAYYFILPMVLWFADKKNGTFFGLMLFLLGVFFHRGLLPYVFIYLVVSLNLIWKTRRVGNVWLWTGVGALLVGLSIWVGCHYSWLDLSRFSGERYEPGFMTLLKRHSLPWVIKCELILAPLLLLVVSSRVVKRENSMKSVWLPWLFLLPSIVPFGVEEVMSAGERYALLMPWAAMLGTIHLVGLRWKGEQNRRPAINAVLLIASLGFLALAMPGWYETCHPKKLDPDFRSFEKITDVLRHRDIPMLICRRDIHFYYKFRTGRDAFSFEPEAHWDKKRIWRLVYGLTTDEILARLAKSPGMGTCAIEAMPVARCLLIREDCWEMFRRNLRWEEDSNLFDLVNESWLNPSKPRPAFLYGKHKNDIKTEFNAL